MSFRKIKTTEACEITHIPMTPLRREIFNGEIYAVGSFNRKKRYQIVLYTIGEEALNMRYPRMDSQPQAYIVDVRTPGVFVKHQYPVSDLKAASIQLGWSVEAVIAYMLTDRPCPIPPEELI